MTRENQYIRKSFARIFEVIDIVEGQTRRGDKMYFVTNHEIDLDSYSDDSIFDYVRLFGYASVEDVKAQHPEDTDMYIAECIATVTSTYDRDNDPCYDDLNDAVNHQRRRWFPQKKKSANIDSSDMAFRRASFEIPPIWNPSLRA